MVKESIEKLLTETENLWYNCSIKRLQEIIKDKDTKVIQMDTDGNSCGRFIFFAITNKRYKGILTFYSFGLHEYRNEYLYKKAYFYVSYHNDLSKEINKNIVIKRIDDEYFKYSILAKKDKRERDETFCMVSSLADEDFAMSNLY